GDESRLRLTLDSTNLFEGAGQPRGDWLSWAEAGAEAGRLVMIVGGADGSRKVGEGSKGVVMLRPYQDVTSASVARSVAEYSRESGLAWSVAFLGFSVLVLFVIFGATEPHEGRGFTGIPPRRFTLPVRTTTLVLWPLLLGSASVLALVI